MKEKQGEEYVYMAGHGLRGGRHVLPGMKRNGKGRSIMFTWARIHKVSREACITGHEREARRGKCLCLDVDSKSE